MSNDFGCSVLASADATCYTDMHGQKERRLAHPNAAVRRASAEMLRRYTSAPYQSAIKSARAALLDLPNDPEPTVREAAKETLRVIDADPGKAGERK